VVPRARLRPARRAHRAITAEAAGVGISAAADSYEKPGRVARRCGPQSYSAPAGQSRDSRGARRRNRLPHRGGHQNRAVKIPIVTLARRLRQKQAVVACGPVQLRSASFGAMRQQRILNGRWADKHAGDVIKDAAAVGSGIAGQSAVGHALSNTVRAISFPDKHTPWPSTVPCRLRTCPRTRYRSCPLLGRSTRACCRCCART